MRGSVGSCPHHGSWPVVLPSISTLVTTWLAAASGRCGRRKNSFSWGIFFQREETFMTPVIAVAAVKDTGIRRFQYLWPRLSLRARSNRYAKAAATASIKFTGDSLSRAGNIRDTLGDPVVISQRCLVLRKRK